MQGQGQGQGGQQQLVLFVLGTDGGVMAVDAVTGHMTAMVRAADATASGIGIFPLGEQHGGVAVSAAQSIAAYE